MSKSPLEIALESKGKPKTCASCQDRVIVKGANYCKVSGKMLHPMLLAEPYAECPIEKKDKER